MPHTYYPIALDLKDRRCLVVGGGAIATDKVTGLLAADAIVTVISPEVSAEIEFLAGEGRIALQRRPYRSGDLAGIYLCYAATDDVAANAAIAAEARDAGVLMNAVDDPPNCDFFAMALVRRGDLQIAISTNGHSPAFARWFREQLDAALPAEYGDLVRILSEVRGELRRRGPIPGYAHWKTVLGAHLVERLQRGEGESVRGAIRQALLGAQTPGGTAPARWEGN